MIFSVQTIAEPQLAQQCDTSLQHKPVIILINADFETYNTLPALQRGITGKSKRLYRSLQAFPHRVECFTMMATLVLLLVLVVLLL